MAGHATYTLDEDAAWTVIDTQRLQLAEFLRNLHEDDWVAPSLCSGWTVRDVVAHLTLAHTGPGRALRELLRAGGNVDQMIHDMACRHAATPPDDLLGQLRSMAGSRRLPPVVTALEPLIDLLVHGQDIALALQRSWPMPADAAATAATRVWTMRPPLARAFPIRTRLRSFHLVATDVAWSAGSGPPVEAPIAVLLLLLTGRTLLLDRLAGDGAEALSAAVRPLAA